MNYSAGPEKQRLAFHRLFDLAEGPTARVELCRITQGGRIGEMVAVKRLKPEIAEQPEFVDMFRDEMWMTASLHHPNVARVVGWGEDDQGLYLAAEFVRGVPLSRLMRNVFSTGEEFTERLVVYMAGCICGGLVAAHELRGANGDYLDVVHRDLTPGNILLGFDGAVKITDFGLAKAKQRITHTAVGITKGEPAYMSPEQVTGQRLDGRSDLFSLGVLLFELLSKKKPWNVRGVSDALQFIVGARHPDLSGLSPRTDRALVALVDRCLAKDPAQRWPNARQLKAQLDQWLHVHGYNDSEKWLARFVRRNALRQMRWLERAIQASAPVLPGAAARANNAARQAEPAEDLASTRAVNRRPPAGASSQLPPSSTPAKAGAGSHPPERAAATEPTRFIRKRQDSSSQVSQLSQPSQLSQSGFVPPPTEGVQPMRGVSQNPAAAQNLAAAQNPATAQNLAAAQNPATAQGSSAQQVQAARQNPADAGIHDAPTTTDEHHSQVAAMIKPLPVPQPLAVPPLTNIALGEPPMAPSRPAEVEVATTRRSSVSDQVQAEVMQMAMSVQDLSEMARLAAIAAKEASERAARAADHAARMSQHMALSAKALEHASEALRLARIGDEQGAQHQLKTAHHYQQQVSKR